MEIPRTASLSCVLDEQACTWARSCSGNWWAGGGQVLTEKKQWSCHISDCSYTACVLFHVGAHRPRTVSLRLSAASSAGWCGCACWPCLMGIGGRGNLFLYYFHTYFNKWKKEKKTYLAELLFVAVFWVMGNKASREIEGQILQPFTALPDHHLGFRCEELKEILDMTESPLSGDTQSSIYSYSTLSFWSSRSLGENWHQALRYLSS